MGNIERKKINIREFDSSELQKVQALAIDMTSTRTDELLEKYKTFIGSHNGQYINSDLMKMVFEIYAESRENRNKYNLAVANSAACLTNELYLRTISNPNVERCIYIAGPYGAGKSYFTQSLFLKGLIPENTIVYEGSITPPAFVEKVKLAIDKNIKPEIIIINPTLELSMQNIREREKIIGRGVTKSEVVEKYAGIYPNMIELLSQVPNLSFQVYNKRGNVPEDLSVSYDINDLYHGTKEEISRRYDYINNKQLNSGVIKDDER